MKNNKNKNKAKDAGIYIYKRRNGYSLRATYNRSGVGEKMERQTTFRPATMEQRKRWKICLLNEINGNR